MSAAQVTFFFRKKCNAKAKEGGVDTDSHVSIGDDRAGADEPSPPRDGVRENEPPRTDE